MRVVITIKQDPPIVKTFTWFGVRSRQTKLRRNCLQSSFHSAEPNQSCQCSFVASLEIYGVQNRHCSSNDIFLYVRRVSRQYHRLTPLVLRTFRSHVSIERRRPPTKNINTVSRIRFPIQEHVFATCFKQAAQVGGLIHHLQLYCADS